MSDYFKMCLTCYVSSAVITEVYGQDPTKLIMIITMLL